MTVGYVVEQSGNVIGRLGLEEKVVEGKWFLPGPCVSSTRNEFQWIIRCLSCVEVGSGSTRTSDPKVGRIIYPQPPTGVLSRVSMTKKK